MSEAAEKLLTPKDSNPLLSLHEVNAPADISWWPQTLGWHLLLCLVFIFLLYRTYLVFRKYLSNAYRRGALLQLVELGDEQSDLEKIPQVLRKTALYAHDRHEVAPLIGHEWECWLDKQCKKAEFSGRYSGMLAQLAYSHQNKLAKEELVALRSQVELWIKNHRGKDD